MANNEKNDLPVISTTKRNDFVEIKFTGYSNGNIFDSNIEEDLKKINPDAKIKELITIIGQGMVIQGFDKALEDKEVGKEYVIEIPSKEGFGERKRELIKTIPLKVFTAKEVMPKPGMVLALDENLVKIVAVSGARVVADFNNPLSGKDLSYKFTIVRILEDEKEKIKNLFGLVFGFAPDFEITDKVVVSGQPFLESFVKAFKDKFKELIGKDLEFRLKEPEKEKREEENKPEEKQ